ncbi:MAG TPA: hypothetical protein VFX50_13225 [Gemmatimonadales bacterium]|nr:hypothetical protein [Gemmatimonadales bacterium]
MRPYPIRRPDGLYGTEDGAVLLTANEMCLLLALRDFEGGIAPNRRAWTGAAMRYLMHVRSEPSWRKLYLSAWAMPDALVEQWRLGIGIGARLRPLGRCVLEGRVRTTLVTHGPWRGFDALVRSVAAKRQARERRRARSARRTHDASRLQYARGALWGGPGDGTNVLVTVPPPAEVVIGVTLLDGSRSAARYALHSGMGAEIVEGPPAARHDPGSAEAIAIEEELLRRRPFRYRYAGMATPTAT